MKQTLILTLLAFAFLPAAAQLTRWRAGAGQLDMGKQLTILEDKEGALTIDSVARITEGAKAKFTPSQQSILHFGFTNSIYWLHFTLDNPTNDSLLLELDHAFLPTADLYIDNNNHWQLQHAGFHIPLTQKPVLSAAQVFPLIKGRHDYYLRLQPFVHAIPVHLWARSRFHEKASQEKFVFGVYTGLLLFAIAINIFLFFTFRRWYYLNYCILVFFYILSSALVMEGYAVYFFPHIDLMFWYRIVPVLDMPALLFYCLSFLEVKRYAPRLHKTIQWFSFTLLAYILVLTFLPLLPVLVANQVLALAVFILAITMGIATGRKGNKLGYYFVTAYSIWFVLINLELAYIQTGRPPHIGPMSYVSIAIFIEAFLLAYLLIQRFKWERQEDQRLQIEMQAHINKMHREFQHAILSSKIEIQEQTFQEISQEIHDNIGQILSLAKLHIATMESGGSPALDNKIREAKNLVSKAIHDLRNLSHRLNTGYITEVGFDTAVKRELETIRRSGVYDTRFILIGRACRFDQQKELILFRIVQELLNNIIKHAKAKTITVELNYSPEGLLAQIRDDGKGFDRASITTRSNGRSPNDHNPEQADPLAAASRSEDHGLGIPSMYHRASLIEAEFQLTSTIGAGTLATIRLPLAVPKALAKKSPL